MQRRQAGIITKKSVPLPVRLTPKNTFFERGLRKYPPPTGHTPERLLPFTSPKEFRFTRSRGASKGSSLNSTAAGPSKMMERAGSKKHEKEELKKQSATARRVIVPSLKVRSVSHRTRDLQSVQPDDKKKVQNPKKLS